MNCIARWRQKRPVLVQFRDLCVRAPYIQKIPEEEHIENFLQFKVLLHPMSVSFVVTPGYKHC